MMERTLEKIAEQILSFDEASLTSLWRIYKDKMENLDVGREWEKAVIIFFIINSVRVKNDIFNNRIMKEQGHLSQPKPPRVKPDLKLVK
ncbi:MAG: hypothetical protein PHY31_03970 [Smithellaceae bacterium]|nr:hypothetical protein [Smithellaceae bacterium]